MYTDGEWKSQAEEKKKQQKENKIKDLQWVLIYKKKK